MNQTLKKIERILTSEYNTSDFVDFIREIFPGVRILSPDSFHKEFSNFSSHIEGQAHIGRYTDPDGKVVSIHAVRLVKESYVENSRSTQRSYAKRLMENGNADAAIIAFYTEGDPKWRLSFVRLDYEIKFENGKLNTKENMTPAKRYSYLVGKDEPCHTAISRFRRFIVDEAGAVAPTIDDLEEAFSVEKVTEEFFNLYCEKFYQLREALEANEDFVIEAQQHNFTSEQFAKKLMGQIVFLYFLQKKGWLGVPAWPNELNEKEYRNAFFAHGAKSRELIPKVYIKIAEDRYRVSGKALEEISDEDEAVLASCVKGQPWGNGSKTFMRTLFNFSQRKKANFFDDYLEPLFYDALNVNRGEQGYDPALHCRIPFLSGGLFEPIDGYDWKHNDFNIPNEVFSNKKDENDREADGILDIFDRYNFTMSEDEPLEREVAIDPEMLGKVFENLLEVKDRKSKGAFYTPRDVVHYMCQESLISYLIQETGLKDQDIRDFILLGDFLKDEDTSKDKRHGIHDMMISEEIYKIDQNGNIVVNRLKDIDEALANIRVADPAVGSGAFPLGMLNEIVRARENISAYMAITQNSYETRMMYSNERSPYNLKRETIKNSIFAADVEPSAVDIARLRLWLSLVIDDEINPDAQNPLEGHRNPIPLPNLECNIVCGNSLNDEFEGHRLIPQSSVLNTQSGTEYSWRQSELEMLIPKLIDAQNRLFNCDDPLKKVQIKEEVSAIKDQMIRTELSTFSSESLEKYEKSKQLASKPYVLWQLDFARVFQEKGGFDVVIGNPPYLESRSEGFSEDFKNQLQDKMKKKYGKNQNYITRGSDLLIYFFEEALSLINPKGINTFITQNSWLDTDFGQKFQQFLLQRSCPCVILDTDFKQFKDSANINTIITFIKDKSFEHEKLSFIRLHRPFDEIYFSPFSVDDFVDTDLMTAKVFSKFDSMLREFKWGFIYNAPGFFLELISLLRQKGKTAEQIHETTVSIGQGLNLKKSFFYDGEIKKDINPEAIVPIFTVVDNGALIYDNPSTYIVDKAKLDAEGKQYVKEHKLDCFDGNKSRKVPPALIMPRGVSNRYYTAYNRCHGYSASYVDIYVDDFERHKELVKKIWVFTNSTLFKLYREITGRNNLGGGMLKAESTDIKTVPILFNIQAENEIEEIISEAQGYNVQDIKTEVNSPLQKKIDKIIYDYLEIDESMQMNISEYLIGLVESRYNKSKT